MWSIIHRELLEQARRSHGTLLRLAGGAILIGALAFAWRQPVVQMQSDGRGLFTMLNHLVISMIWLLAPVLTADCISRERREGTLGLLFLTPLSSLDVVIGKASAHALRAFTVVLVAIPILAVPIMLGGLTGWDVLRMLLLDLAVLGLSLAAGLLASSLAESWVRARLLAFGLAVGAGVGFATIYSAFSAMANWRLLQRLIPNTTFTSAWMGQLWGWRQRLGLGGREATASTVTFWDPIAGNPANAQSVGIALWVLGLSLVLVVLGIAVAAFSVRRSWQPWKRPGRCAVPGVGVESSDSKTRTKKWGKRARQLDRNPIRWMMMRTGAQTKFALAWLAVALASAMGIIGPAAGPLNAALLLLGAVGLVSSYSFQAEREQGSLELLMVTPLTPRRVIYGRIAVLALQFTPATVVVALAIVCQVAVDPSPRHWSWSHWSLGFLTAWGTAMWAAMALGLLVSLGAGAQGIRHAFAAAVPPLIFAGLGALMPTLLFPTLLGFAGMVAVFAMAGHLLLRAAVRRLQDRVFMQG